MKIENACQIIRFSFKTTLLIMLLVSCQRGEDAGSFSMNSHDDLKFRIVNERELISNYYYDYTTYSGLINSVIGEKHFVTSMSNGRIFSFDMSSGALVEMIELPDDGPKSIEATSDFDQAIMVSENKYLYFNHMLNNIYMVDSAGAEKLVSMTDEEFAFGNSFFAKPLKKKSKVYTSINPSTSKDLKGKKAVLAYDLVTQEVSKVLDFPDVYHGNYYGSTPYFYWVSLLYNESKEEYVASFPVSEDLYVYDKNLKFKFKKNAASEFIGNVPPMVANVDFNSLPSWESERGYFQNSGYYAGLTYNALCEEYYRLSRIPVLEDVEAGYIHSIVVLDADLNNIGEVQVPNRYRPEMLFCNKDGLNVLNSEKINEIDFNLPFDVVEFNCKH